MSEENGRWEWYYVEKVKNADGLCVRGGLVECIISGTLFYAGDLSVGTDCG